MAADQEPESGSTPADSEAAPPEWDGVEGATIQRILDQVRSYSPDADVEPLLQAYLLAAKAHAGQKRKSGEPYLTHPLAVAMILADMRMDTDTIATALLHDALEDNPITKAEMTAEIGEEVTELVDGVTKIGKLKFRSKEELAAENFRKMMLGMSQDLRIILVKLADRLHNVRTLEHHRPDKARKVARETMDVFVPIANRLGIERIKSELEDRCFAVLHPEAHEAIHEHLERTAADREHYIAEVADELGRALQREGIEGRVSGRAKAPWSIFQKMHHQDLELGEIPDLIAFRVIVGDVGACYHVLGVVHAAFPPIPDRIKDYIARPKPNGYQSLHTTVIGPHRRRIEIQIRTEDMHRVAEQGIAAHWRYKEGRLALSRDDVQRIGRIRDLFESAREAETATDFMETLKVEFYADEVFVFTPNGDIRTFPAGATALDFAFAIHTDVGLHCTGAKIDGRMVPLRYELQSGDTVEILTSPSQQPNRGWLEFLKTGRAIQKVRRHLREEERDLGARLGRDMVDGELRRFHTTLDRVTKAGTLKAVVEAREVDTAEDLFVEIARGRLGLGSVVRDLLPEGTWQERTERPQPSAPGTLGGLFGRWSSRRSESPVLIAGEDGVLVSMAKCCEPLPGDAVIGFITRGRGITVHRADCDRLRQLEAARQIAVEWDPESAARHASHLELVASDRPGVLADVSKICEQQKVNINRIDAQPIDGDRSLIRLEVAVRDVEEVGRIVRSLQRVRGVEDVRRV